MLLLNVAADGLGRGEVEGSTLDRHQLARGDKALVDGRVLLSVEH